MSWGSVGEFLAMGGYAFFVWGSFLAAAVCMTAEPLLLRARHRRALERLGVERKCHEAQA
jgi:heme exporter protein D